ncbi:hypothetical protein MKW92_028880, partial [Papaver armeniacum]
LFFSSSLKVLSITKTLVVLTKNSVRSDNVIPLCMKSNTKPAFRGLRVKVVEAPVRNINDYIFRQNFTIRSFEIGPNRMATIAALLNHLQDSIANNVRAAGLLGDGFGATPEMTRRNLIWVVAKMHVLVDRYPAWGDVVQIDNWFSDASVKNGTIGFFVMPILEKLSIWIMMNKKTRKMSKFPEEVRGELTPITMDYCVSEDIKLSKLHDNTTARWSDLDINHHVNFAKYIGWILENVPILKTHELFDLVLEFKRECREGDELKSLTKIIENGSDNAECQHMLQLENGSEVMRGRTKWRPNITDNV